LLKDLSARIVAIMQNMKGHGEDTAQDFLQLQQVVSLYTVLLRFETLHDFAWTETRGIVSEVAVPVSVCQQQHPLVKYTLLYALRS
jgi:hypothetical protein